MRALLGEILVAAKLVTQSQVDAALAVQAHTGRRLGEELIARGLLEETALAQVLSKQLSVPWVALHLVRIERRALELFPAEVCKGRQCLPLYLGVNVDGEEAVYVATDDPTVPALADELAASAGLPVLFMVAPARELRLALDAAYAWRDTAEVSEAYFRWNGDNLRRARAEEPAVATSARVAAAPQVLTDSPLTSRDTHGTAAEVRWMTLLDGTRVPIGARAEAALRARSAGHRVLLEQRARRVIQSASAAGMPRAEARVTRGIITIALSLFACGLMNEVDLDELLADFETS